MPKPVARRRLLQILGSTAVVGTAGCAAREPTTPWCGVGAAVVEFPPEEARIIPASAPVLDDLNHVKQAIDEALSAGETEIETTSDLYRKTDDSFRDLPHILVIGVRVPDGSPEFNTPGESILPDFMREHDLVPVIFVETGNSPVAVWPLHYELG